MSNRINRFKALATLALFAGLAIGICGVAVAVPGAVAENARPVARAGASEPKKLLQERVTICRNGIAAVTERMQQGRQPMTPEFVRHLGAWYRRLAEAEVAVAVDDAARMNAAEAYVERSRKLLKNMEQRLKAGADVNDAQVAEANYYANDAELLLARLKGAAAGE